VEYVTTLIVLQRAKRWPCCPDPTQLDKQQVFCSNWDGSVLNRLQNSFRNKNISKKLNLRLKNTIIDKTLTYASETWILTKRDRKQINIFERKMYRRILGPVYDNEKEYLRILTNKEIYAMVKNSL
jgi:hypothetical protein